MSTRTDPHYHGDLALCWQTHADPPAPSAGATAGEEHEKLWSYADLLVEVARLRSDLVEAIDQRNTLQRDRDIFNDQAENLSNGLRQEIAANGVLKREITTLRSDLAHAQAERDRLLEVSTAAIEGCSEAAVAQKAELDQLRAQVQAMRAVVEAAKGVVNCALADAQDQVWVHASGGGCLELIRDALDQQQPQEVHD